ECCCRRGIEVRSRPSSCAVLLFKSHRGLDGIDVKTHPASHCPKIPALAHVKIVQNRCAYSATHHGRRSESDAWVNEDRFVSPKWPPSLGDIGSRSKVDLSCILANDGRDRPL